MKKLLLTLTFTAFVFTLSQPGYGQSYLTDQFVINPDDYSRKMQQLKEVLSTLPVKEEFKNKPDDKTQWYSNSYEDILDYLNNNLSFMDPDVFKNKVMDIFDNNDIILIGGVHSLPVGELELMAIIYEYAEKTDKKLHLFYEWPEKDQKHFNDAKKLMAGHPAERKKQVCADMFLFEEDPLKSETSIKSYLMCLMLLKGINVTMADTNKVEGDGPNYCCRYTNTCIQDTNINVQSEEGHALRNCNIAAYMQKAVNAGEKAFFAGGGLHLNQGSITPNISLAEIIKIQYKDKKIISLTYGGGPFSEETSEDGEAVYSFCENCKKFMNAGRHPSENIYKIRPRFHHAMLDFVPPGQQDNPQYLHRPADILLMVPSWRKVRDIGKELTESK